jgi:hypothetical protein
VLLLDQRGTGRSTPVTARTVGDMPADYLKLLRADRTWITDEYEHDGLRTGGAPCSAT